MASANVKLGINGVDLTVPAWKSVEKKGKKTASSIGGYFKRALSMAGAYIGVRSIMSTINEMGNLSDMAMRAHTSVDELTKSATAFGVVGLKGLDENGLSMMLMQLERRTGRKGMPGFYQTIEEIQKIPDLTKRGEAAMAAFGRSGLMLQPIINGGEEATKALQRMQAAMPGVSQAAADAGDKAADAFGILGTSMKSLLMDGIAFVIEHIDSDFTGGIREAALLAAAYLEYYVKAAFLKLQEGLRKFTASMVGYFGTAWSYISTLVTEGHDAAKSAASVTWEASKMTYDDVDKWAKERESAIDDMLAKRKAAIASFNKDYEKTQELLGKGADNEEGGGEERRAPRVNNALINAGSNAERLLVMLGPQTSEAKKQTGYLKTIAENTKATAKNTEATAENTEEAADEKMGTV